MEPHHRFSGYSVVKATMQDVLAVGLLVVANDQTPSPWALLVIPLAALAGPLLGWLLKHVDHRELLTLFGVGLAVTGSAVFELVGLTGTLGALLAGVLLAKNPRSGELYRNMSLLKDFFLVGFFLSIGMAALPTLGALACAAIFLAVLAIRPLIYFGLFSISKVRSRTSWQASLSLSTYSEFGLVALVAAAAAGWVGNDLVAMMAVLVAASFAVAASVGEHGDSLYSRWRETLKRFERSERLPGDQDLDAAEVDVVIFGMGRMGSRAYDAVSHSLHNRVLGIDNDQAVVAANQQVGRNAMTGDATDADLWSRAHSMLPGLQWVLLTMPLPGFESVRCQTTAGPRLHRKHCSNVCLSRRGG